jgi:hypothetical protein
LEAASERVNAGRAQPQDRNITSRVGWPPNMYMAIGATRFGLFDAHIEYQWRPSVGAKILLVPKTWVVSFELGRGTVSMSSIRLGFSDGTFLDLKARRIHTGKRAKVMQALFEQRDERFREMDRRYAELRWQHTVGVLNSAAFTAHCQQLALRDEAGRLWAKEPKTAMWYCNNGHGWAPGMPPGY